MMNNLDWIKSYLCTKIIQATPQELFPFAFTHFKGTSLIIRSMEAFSKWCENEWCPDSKIDTDEIVFQQSDQNTYRIAYQGYSGVVYNDMEEWTGTSLNRLENGYLNFRGKTRDECVQNFVETIKEADNPLPVNALAKGNAKVVISYDTESCKWKGIVLKDGSTKFVEGETVKEVLLNSGLDETGKCGYNYKVVAELREDLSQTERASAIQKIKNLQERLKIINLDKITYCKAQPINGNDDFGAVTFFYSGLKDMKHYFSRLEYYNLREERAHIAVNNDNPPIQDAAVTSTDGEDRTQ